MLQETVDRGLLARELLGFFRPSLGGIDSHPGPSQIDRPQANEQGDGCHHLKINERLHRQPAHLAQVFAMPGYSHHQCRKQQRRDQRFDQPHEDGAGERIEVNTDSGQKQTQQQAHHHGHQNPLTEVGALQQLPHGLVPSRFLSQLRVYLEPHTFLRLVSNSAKTPLRSRVLANWAGRTHPRLATSTP